MPVLVTGATGLVGRALVPRLLDAGGQVRVYVRRDAPEYRSLGVKVAVGEADHEGRIESALEQVHTVVHLVGGPAPERDVSVEWLNLETTEVTLRAAENAGVPRFVFLSPLGADPASPHAYLAAKARAEAAVGAAPLEHAIFRCAPILGPGSVLGALLERGLPPGGGATRLNPVAVADVAAAVAAADTRDAEVRGTWELGGPEVVTLEDLARRVGARRSPLARLLPGGVKALAPIVAADRVADPAAAVAQFGLRLTPVDRALASA